MFRSRPSVILLLHASATRRNEVFFIKGILGEIVTKAAPPVPKNDVPGAPTRALISGSYDDRYIGVMFFFRVVDAARQNTMQHNAFGATHDVFGAGGDLSKGAAITTSHTLTPSLSSGQLAPSPDCHDTRHTTTTTLPKPSVARDSTLFRSLRPTWTGLRKRGLLRPQGAGDSTQVHSRRPTRAGRRKRGPLPPEEPSGLARTGTSASLGPRITIP